MNLYFKDGIKNVKPEIKENDNDSVTLKMGKEEFTLPTKKYKKIVSNPYANTEVKFLEVVKHYQEIEFKEIK
jgi:hypothetical protein